MNNLAEKLKQVLSNGVKNSIIQDFEIRKANRYNNDETIILGITFKSVERWHWFEFNNDMKYIFFNHSYNRYTGKSIKGTIYGFNLKQKLNKILNTDLF